MASKHEGMTEDEALKAKLAWLLTDACVQLGFCNQLTAETLFEGSNELTAGSFADSVLRAEGMAPEYEKHFHRELAVLFHSRLGPSATLRPRPNNLSSGA